MDAKAMLARSIGNDEAEQLLPHLEVEQFRPGMKMFREGVPSNHLYFLVDGSLTAAVGTSRGDVALGIVHPGAWLGEIGFIDHGPATSTLTAGEYCTALRISHASLLELQESHPHAASVLLRAVTRQLADRLKKSTTGIVEEVAEGRYRVKAAEDQRSWLQNALGWLMGTGGHG